MKLFCSEKKIFIFILICLIFLNCPKRVSVKTTKIEVVYLSSLIDDINNPEPYLCGAKNFEGIKVGYLNFATPFMSRIFQRLGFYNILDEIPLDFLITNQPVYGTKFLSIPVDLGYGFKNYEGIRFAIFTKYRDSLSISDQVKLATVKERSDVLWIVDKKLLSSPPIAIDFIIRERTLQDTIVKKIKISPDTTLLNTIHNFQQLLLKTLQTKIFTANQPISEFIFNKIKQKYNTNLMIYPVNMIKDNLLKDSLTVAEFMDKVNCDTKFKVKELSKSEVNKILNDKIYAVIGKITKQNIVLMPDPEGDYLFDLIFY
ncbi:MAG: hypothetical protein ABIL46_02350 [candidate division WOR-3 bacterium]